MDKKGLRKEICNILKIPKVTEIIEKQINKYVVELGMSYKEIAQALAFFIEVEKGDYIPKYGIAIVPTIRDRSNEFFAKRRRQIEEQLKSIDKNKEDPIILKANAIKKRRPLPKIDIEKIDLDVD